jgi:methanogenic corrinoid protein MtbC1
MKDVIAKLKEEGPRDKIKVIIDGGQMDEHVCHYVGADAFVIDAVAGINFCKEWMSYYNSSTCTI